jgi:hypothetical protein
MKPGFAEMRAGLRCFWVHQADLHGADEVMMKDAAAAPVWSEYLACLGIS